MGLNVEDVIAGFDPAERRKVEELAAEFISEEMTLRDLCTARHLTQVSVAPELGVSQDAVSRIEQRSDLLPSTLRRTVEAMGGRRHELKERIAAASPEVPDADPNIETSYRMPYRISPSPVSRSTGDVKLRRTKVRPVKPPA